MADEETQAANDAIRAEAAAAKAAATDTTPAPEASDTTTTEDVKLGEAGEKALEAFKKRARDAEKEARDLAVKVKAFEDQNKTDAEKTAEKTASLEAETTTLRSENMRLRVAMSKKLPMELATRLQGETEKDLEADADRLLELVKPNGKPSGDIDAGKGEGGGATSFNDLLRATANR